MPKKIKKTKATKLEYRNKEKLLNVNNIHFILLTVFILVLCVCVGVGAYTYSKDKYHVHKDEAIVRFIYSEKVDEGYNVYEVKELENKDVYATFSTPTENVDEKWGRYKYLDFNEEIYASNVMDAQTTERENDAETVWSLELEFIDGTQKYYSSNSSDMDKTELANIILKYFEKEILYK